jgi:hypothetical protein
MISCIILFVGVCSNIIFHKWLYWNTWRLLKLAKIVDTQFRSVEQLVKWRHKYESPRTNVAHFFLWNYFFLGEILEWLIYIVSLSVVNFYRFCWQLVCLSLIWTGMTDRLVCALWYSHGTQAFAVVLDFVHKEGFGVFVICRSLSVLMQEMMEYNLYTSGACAVKQGSSF